MGSYITDEDRAGFRSDPDEDIQTEDETPETPDEEEPEQSDEGEEVAEQPVETDEATEEQAAEDPIFPVVVDGQSMDVPLSELRDGYLRRNDYTRKTQLLGAERRQLADAQALIEALDRNPRQTLNVLARHYQIDLGESSDGEEVQMPSPEQLQLQQLAQWQQAELARQREAAVDAELDRLHREYGEFSDEALFTFAVDRNVNDLEVALRAMNFRPITDRTTEKRRVAAVSGGASRNGASPKAGSEPISSFQDAYRAAKRELDLGS